jgi:glycosyltransferase involved in cell wall biosynthesis
MPVTSIGVIHDLMHRYERKYPEMGNWKIYYWREQAFKNLCKYNKGIIVDSRLGKEQVIDSYKISGDKVYILPFIPPSYIYSVENKKKIDEIDSLPQKFIFYPAQFWEHKNHRNLVEAIYRLKEEIPDICLVLVGSKKNNHRQIMLLVKKYELQEHVLFLGYISNENLVELYRRSRAMIYPSFIGPTNIPPLEAMAANCPAAVSDVYAMKEQLGDAVLYFNPNSIEEIAQTIKRLWEDDELCNELRRKGKERIQRHNTQEIFNKNVLSIINDLTV